MRNPFYYNRDYRVTIQAHNKSIEFLSEIWCMNENFKDIASLVHKGSWHLTPLTRQTALCHRKYELSCVGLLIADTGTIVSLLWWSNPEIYAIKTFFRRVGWNSAEIIARVLLYECYFFIVAGTKSGARICSQRGFPWLTLSANTVVFLLKHVYLMLV